MILLVWRLESNSTLLLSGEVSLKLSEVCDPSIGQSDKVVDRIHFLMGLSD